MTFLQPFFLWFAPFVLVPLVFFLLGPRISREVRFSWVALLLGDLQEGRRGRRMRDWLLVILRMLILASLLLAMARPVWMGRTPPSRIVVDASWSMQPHWDALRADLQELAGAIPVEGLTGGKIQPLPPRPYGTLNAFPPPGVLWVTDGQHGEGSGPVVILPRPCNRGLRLLSWPYAVLPDRPFEVRVLAYSTCEDTLNLRLPEGRIRARDGDTLTLSFEGCVDVAVTGEDAYPEDNHLRVCPPPRPPVRVALLSVTADTVLLSRLLSVFPDLFLRSSRDGADVWVVVGNLALDYDEIRRRRGVWFAPPEGMDPGPGWKVFPFLPDEMGGLRLLENPDLLRSFYDALLGGPGVWLFEEGDTLRLPMNARLSPSPGDIRLVRDSLEVVFTKTGVFRVEGPESLLIVVQPPEEEVRVEPSGVHKGRLPLPLTRPLLLLAVVLLLLEVLMVRRNI